MVDTRRFAQEVDKSILGVDGALQAHAILQNRYRIEGILGVGGMGSVYKARDMQFPEVKRYVAVKEMLQPSTEQSMREQALKNFKREANILAGLNHPAIPTIHDYFSIQERAYLVMEYINGSDLDHILTSHEGFLPLMQVLEWSIALCDVMHYLHNSQPPIIFRDTKPSNIMVDVHGRLRLIDFGIAKLFKPELGKQTMIGTEGYASPESYKGQPSPLSDIFGIGATMHHILTNHDPRLFPPFSFADRPIRASNPEVPPELENIVMKALAFDPNDRFPTALAMKEALSRLVGGGRILTVASGLTSEIDQWDDAADSLGVEARWSFKVEEEIRTQPIVSNNMVFVTVYDNNLYSMDAETGQLKWKYATYDVLASSPAISEEENLVIFGSKDQSLYAVDYRTGKIRWTFQAKGPIYSSPTVKHGHVFFGSDDGNLYALRVATGRKAWEYYTHEAVRSRPYVTEDRVLVGQKGGEMICVDLGGQMKWRFKTRREILSSPVVYKGVAFFGSNDGYLYAVAVDSGWSVWKAQTNKAVIGSPCIGEDKVFVGSGNGIMYAFEVSSGREKWKFETDSQITASPIYANGTLYFGAINHKLYALEAKTGKEKWSYTTQGPIPGAPFVHEGVVYVGSTDQHLYALKA
jgi:outer membrane protein assembly factor BamB/tRNA A-37 threonylcarbamoyl transferase component Bud32